FLAINPAMLTVLAFAIPFVPWLGRLAVVPRLIGGTLVQALSPLWAALFDGQWPIVVFLVQFSLGEAVAIPMIQEYAMKVAPKGEEALYSSMASVPKLVGRVASLALSAVLLDAFCPAAGAACADPASSTPL